MTTTVGGLDLLSDLVHITKTITFTGSAGAGAVGTVTVFTVTGRVALINMTAFATSGLTGATATIELGTSSTPTVLIGSTTATAVGANNWWDTTAGGKSGSGFDIVLQVGQTTLSSNLIITVGTAAVSGGVIVFDAWYRPVTAGGSLA